MVSESRPEPLPSPPVFLAPVMTLPVFVAAVVVDFYPIVFGWVDKLVFAAGNLVIAPETLLAPAIKNSSYPFLLPTAS
jgi:hypothetical protein